MSKKTINVNPVRTITSGTTTVVLANVGFNRDEILYAKYSKLSDSLNKLCRPFGVRGIAKLDPKDEYDAKKGEAIANKRVVVQGLSEARKDLREAIVNAKALVAVLESLEVETNTHLEINKISLGKLTK